MEINANPLKNALPLESRLSHSTDIRAQKQSSCDSLKFWRKIINYLINYLAQP